MLERILPVLRERSPEIGFDLRDHELVRPADEPLDDLSFGQDPAQRGEDLHVDPDGEPLAIHEDAVAIEDHQLDRIRHQAAD